MAPVERRFEAIEIGDDRSLEPQRPRCRWPPTEQRWTPAEVDSEVHDDPLALGVDRRVGDLGERLAEVIDDPSVERAPAGRRRVVAHAPQRLVALDRHRPDVEPEPLRVEPDEVAQRRCRRRPGSGPWRGAGPRRSPGCRRGPGSQDDLRHPIDVGVSRAAVGPRAPKEGRLRVGVLEDPSPRRVDKQHLARPETSAADDFGRRQRDRAGLRCGHDEPIPRDRERRRTKTVAVDHRADPSTVGEDDRGGSVPRSEEARRPPAQGGDRHVRAAPHRHRLGDSGKEGDR